MRGEDAGKETRRDKEKDKGEAEPGNVVATTRTGQ